jgi:hypothetical protein
MQSRPESAGCHSSYYLLEEARESWEHIASNEVVYLFTFLKIASDPLAHVAKNFMKGCLWIEAHLTFRRCRDMHYVLTYEFDLGSERSWQVRKCKNALVSVNGNASMLVDDAQFIEAPKQITMGRCGIPSVIRLKRFDDTRCVCGYSVCIPRKRSSAVAVTNVQNRKVRMVGIRERQFSERPHQLVQGRTSTVEKFTKDERNSWRDAPDLKIKEIATILEITLGPNTVGFRFSESAKLIPQFAKVFLRPGGFGLGISH